MSWFWWGRKFRTRSARKQEQKRLAIKTTILSFVMAACVGLLLYIINLDRLTIQQVHVNTDGALATDVLAAALQDELDTFYFNVVPKKSIFFMKKGPLIEILQERFPRIDSSVVKRNGLQTITVTIKERNPVALWCGDVVPPVAEESTSRNQRATEQLWGTCYLMDKTGFLYAQAPIFTGNIFPRYYGSLTYAEPVGQQYVPVQDFHTWQNFYLSLVENDVSPQALLFVDEQDVELYLTNGFRVLVPRQEDVQQTKRRLISILDSGTIDKSRHVEYIDLRFGNKAFVKYVDNVD